jgi:hypothetical protein
MTSDRDEREQPETSSRQEAARIDVNELSIISNNEQETEEEKNSNSDFVNEGACAMSVHLSLLLLFVCPNMLSISVNFCRVPTMGRIKSLVAEFQ